MLLLLLAACGPSDETVPRDPLALAAGAPVAGVAEGYLDLPVGGPMGGYSYRCDYLGKYSAVDNRQSNYTVAWAPSAGVHTRQAGKALWLENGDQNVVLLKADVIYSHDVLVEAVEAKLIAATGEDLDGRVIITASHTHHGVANFSESVHFYLGGDKFNQEVFERLATSLADLALEAYNSRQEVAIGLGVARDWDPDDRVYRDRRGENDDLAVWDDAEPGMGKDPTLWLLRVDALDGRPLGVFFNFGMHGIVMDVGSPLISTDASGGIETALAEQFDEPVVVAHLQGSGGDASPAGTDEELAKIETIGEYGAPLIRALWEQTPTSADPLKLETVTHAIPQTPADIHVTRNGAVDWYYPPYQEGYVPDEQVYAADGSLLSPLDEFNAEFGGAFCGDEEPLIPSATIGSSTFPYSTCMNVETVSLVVKGIFLLTDDEVAMPFDSSQVANSTAARVGPLAVREADGSIGTADTYFGFFPAETTAMYTEQFKRRSRDELGLDHAYVVGYAQDHEGYFLIPEDWLLGGYEPSINIWGPLQGEHVMEGVLSMMDSHLLSDRLEAQDPLGMYQPTPSRGYDLPALAPDATPDAGTALAAMPEGFFNPFPFSSGEDYEWPEVPPIALQASPDAEIPRVQGMAQLAWQGGDPGVDFPRVVLERQEGGSWVPVTTHAGREIASGMHDMLLLWQPDPLYPADADQSHVWWVGWQAVGHVYDRAGVPEGTYRLHVYGQRYAGGASTWPWPTEGYEVTSDPFVVTPAELSVAWDGATLSAWIQAPEWGYRLIDVEGSSRPDLAAGRSGANPARGATITWELEGGATQEEAPTWTIVGGISQAAVVPPDGAVGATVTDGYGNTGWIEL